MANSAIILYLEFLVGLIFHFEKLDQHELDKKMYVQICKLHILNF